MLYKIYNVIKRKINIIFYIVVIAALLIVTGTFTYSRYTYHYETTVTVTVPASDKCKVYGVNKLGECVILKGGASTDTSVTEAKTTIASKDVVDTSTVEPAAVYVLNEELGVTGTSITSMNSGQSYYFYTSKPTLDTSTGYFTFDTTTGTKGVMSDYISDDTTKYYTCMNTTSTGNCGTVYVIYSYTSSTSSGTTTYYATKLDRYTGKVTSTSSSNPGLYATTDNDATTYYYRGNVTNNYVLFAGYYWRIVRVNGDGSVRLIYDGTEAYANGESSDDRQIGTSKFNEKYYDPTYVGYVYGENLTYQEPNGSINYYNFTNTTIYYFSDDFTCDDNTQTCSLTGTMYQASMKDGYEDIISKYPFTCFRTSSTVTCTQVKEILSYTSGNTYAKAKYHGYFSNSYEDIREDDNSSTIKTTVDNWYYTNILNKYDDDSNSYDDYIADTTFCSDRTISTTSAWNIPTMSFTTYFEGYRRMISTYSPTLECGDTEDMLTVESGKLTYPVGLITVDEASFAGGKTSAYNYLYYLYTGQYYWTMSPSNFTASYGDARVWRMTSTGNLTPLSVVTVDSGVCPVINLSADIYITDGTGTAEDPYQVSLTEPVETCTGTLSECMLLNSTGESTVEDAETATEDKGDPDYSTTATTDEGLYAAEDDYGTSYYFRGAVEDNYVSFAGYTWRIIRRNGDCSVRIIMEDVLDYVAYNEEYDSPKYVGYTYGDDDSTLDAIRENDNDSTIKQYIDSWNEENLIDYADYLSDTLFCNDRTLSTEYTWSNFIDDLYGEYSSYQRLNAADTYSPTLSCSNQLDRYTVSDTNTGNGYLTYPIGLITADEVAMAGNVAAEENREYYLYNGDYWWTMTPSFFIYGYADAWLETDGSLVGDFDVDYIHSARPVVNLSSEILVESGTGTSKDPYVVTLSS